MAMKKASYYLLDVFTNKKFGGNQLAVFPDARNIPELLMQPIACELNLSETVYLFPKNENGHYPMRIFTPGSELPTAGHPTIGAAYYLARESDIANGTIRLQLRQKIGVIHVEIEMAHNLPQKATMYQPLPEFGDIFNNREEISSLLGLSVEDLLDYPVQVVSCGVPYLIVPIKSIQRISAITFRLDLWEKLKNSINAFVYAFTPHGQLPGSDVHGRMFAPEAGILEDPATGSANGPLGCYLSNYKIKTGSLVSEQGFEMGRPSILSIDIRRDSNDNIDQVKVGGQAVFIGKGEIFLD